MMAVNPYAGKENARLNLATGKVQCEIEVAGDSILVFVIIEIPLDKLFDARFHLGFWP